MNLLNLFKRDSNIKEILAPLIQALTMPLATFNEFKVQAAVKDGYKANNMVYRCVNIISNNLVTLDFIVLDKTGKPKDDHPVALLLDDPCPELPPNLVKSIFWKQLELTGSTYIRFLDNAKRPELWPLFPDKVQIVPSTENGKLLKGYRFVNDRGIKGNDITLLPDEVIHLRQVDPSDGLAGISALRAGWKHVDILNEMDTWNLNAFNNRVLPDLAISLKAENVNPESIKTIRDSIETQLSGSKNARKVIIAPSATKVDKLSQTAVEMDYTNSKRTTREDIAVAYGVPLPMLGIYDNGTFANVESAKRDFWEDTLIPKADDFCDTMTWFFRKIGMLKPDERVYYKKQDVKALQRNVSDRVKDADIVSKMLITTAGFDPEEVITEINQAFELGLDMAKLPWSEPEPVVEDPTNPDDPTVDPTTDKPEGDTKKPSKGPGDDTPEKKSQRDMSLADFHWRMIDRKREMWVHRFKSDMRSTFKTELNLLLDDISKDGVDASRLVKISKSMHNTYEAAFKKLYSGVINDFATPLKPLKRAAKKGVKDKTTFDNMVKERIHGFIAQNGGRKVKDIQDVTAKKIEKIVHDAMDRHAVMEAAKEAGDVVEPLDRYLKSSVAEGLKDAYANYANQRALTIARTEVLGAASYGQEVSISLSGASKKEWVSSRDSETRESHAELDGEQINVDDTFSNGCRFPGDPLATPDEIINCRCALIAVDDNDEETEEDV